MRFHRELWSILILALTVVTLLFLSLGGLAQLGNGKPVSWFLAPHMPNQPSPLQKL